MFLFVNLIARILKKEKRKEAWNRMGQEMARIWEEVGEGKPL